MAYVYIVSCKDGTLYTGITTDLVKRMKNHAEGKGGGRSKYMASHGIKSIEAVWTCDEYRVAARLEYAIKQLKREQKQLLIQNPHDVAIIVPKLCEYEFVPLQDVTLEKCLDGSFGE